MSITYVRNRPEGLRHRALIRRWIVPRLRPGCRIPSAAWMGRFLHISAGEGRAAYAPGAGRGGNSNRDAGGLARAPDLRRGRGEG